MAAETTPLELAVTGMTCAACATRIEKVLNRIPGVKAAVNLATEHARLSYDPARADVSTLIGAVRKAGYDASVVTAANNNTEEVRKLAAYRKELRLFWIAAALLAPFMVQMVMMLTLGHHDMLPRWLQLGLALPVQCWIGKRFYVSAFHALR